ncbi:MAG: two-component system sensor histidine kinase CreC [Pseudobdellovibrionaceae bacterium]|nr:two-component system sensor histidine kinase CreC [Pseudobdellovibrionaceae bacterium]
MRLGFGIFLGYVLIAGLAAYFVLNVFVDEIKPGIRQAMEDNLVDAANLLAEIAVDDMKTNSIATGGFARQVTAYQARRLDASIWGFRRSRPGFRVYITDAKGVVRYDSTNEAVGQDYSRWNDVYLTLKGQYGVRSSPDRGPGASPHSTMFVAAPIQADGRILGVLTVAKSNRAMEPFIERTQNKIINAGYWLLAASILIGVLAAVWLTASVRRLVIFAEAVTRGERVVLPSLSILEIKRLGTALQSMRERLEGKRYVEDYITTLTHEMKSPLAAIQGAAELLQEPMAEPQRQRFLSSIREQTLRLRGFIEKMLQQASLENRQVLESQQPVDLVELIQRVKENIAPKALQRGLILQASIPEQAMVQGDPFLLEQALNNLAENALDFSPRDASLDFALERHGEAWQLSLRDHGPGIPDFARERIFERYYSLPRPDGGPKSTGLGLSFVQQVMLLHGGRVELENMPDGGAKATLSFMPKVSS